MVSSGCKMHQVPTTITRHAQDTLAMIHNIPYLTHELHRKLINAINTISKPDDNVRANTDDDVRLSGRIVSAWNCGREVDGTC